MTYGFGAMSVIFNILFPIVFLCILGIFLYTIIKGIGTWNKNNHSPKLTVPAQVVAKRTNVHHQQANSSTTYYVTFQVESGDRMELVVRGSEYGMLAEGDVGMLSFQGTRYLGFERETGV